ncbi:MAG: hypothetical protein JRH18_11485 [Deltaproteobacteria bacterium]|nr:hypothetical protein [Deltaproteobacteria bacterium]MBW2152280.1 hypothetical protein [Deltaproteobacteria bacterium]
MNLKTVHIVLNPDEIQHMMSIAMDENREEALSFIKQTLLKRVEKALQRR